MTPSQEKKYLKCVLKQVEHGAPKALRSRWAELGLWVCTVVVLIIVFQTEDSLHRAVSAGICVLWGALLGGFFVWQLAAKQWPQLRPHVSRESIEQRIAELEP